MAQPPFRLPDSIPGAEAAGMPSALTEQIPTQPEPAPAARYATTGHPEFDPRTGALRERTFPAIAGAALRDPRDATRMARVRLMKGIDFVYSRFLNMGVEQAMAHEVLSQAVQVGPAQMPDLWVLLHRACRVLDVRAPDLFVGHSEAAAQTVGHERPFILVDTGTLDLLDDDELVFVLGREVGHILLGHVTYKMLARSIGVIGEAVGNFTLNVGAMVTTGLEAPLRDWDQFSEFSADRAGLLAVQRREVAINALLQLAGGGHRFGGSLDATAFIEQGRRALTGERPAGARLSAIVRSLQAGAPILAARAAALSDWHAGDEYRALLRGVYPRRAI
ncbi:MAG TPA: M48 family metallopeptidase [Dehalococcoidia bacterium]|jgi:Zn-dependent protease with chaperone function|nr:M48 family metallopeptidase [Dehalococcoidia bacterium]